MSNKNYKPLQLIKNGGLKQALEEGATEIIPLQQPEETPSEGVQSNVQMIEKITEKAKKMQIICRVENIEVETKLNKDDADLIRKYQTEVKNKISELCKESLKNSNAYFEKEQDLVKKHNDKIRELLTDHLYRMENKLRNSDGVWFSYKSFLVWAFISIPCICFTVIFISMYIYTHWILAILH